MPAPTEMPTWEALHEAAMSRPRPGHERALVNMITGLVEYASAHRFRYSSEVGQDAVLGDGWIKIASGLRDLLNGQSDRLDCGTLDGILCVEVEKANFPIAETVAAGFDPPDLEGK